MSSPRFTSTVSDPSPLFEPLVFPSSGRVAPNRFLKCAMSESLSTWSPTDVATRGFPTPEVITLYRHWGAGGWGQVLTGNIMITGEQLEQHGNLVIPAEAPFHGPRFDGYTAMAAATREHGALLVGQVSHPGRQSTEPNPISASGIQTVAPHMHRTFHKPRAATKADIEGVVAGFAHAAEYLEKAGFDGIELHAAHGYLLAEFLSRSTNKRTDGYGGSSENRMRLFFEIADAVKARVSKSFIIGVKINTIEFNDDGVTPEESATFCEALDNAGFDYVELSGGNYEKSAWQHTDEASKRRENFFIRYADDIVKRLKSIKVYASGGFKTLDGMVSALNVVHGVGLGKSACQEPRFPKELLESSGKITGILDSAVVEDNFLCRLFAAGSQIKQIAKGEEPVDMTVPENEEPVWQDTLAQFRKIAQDETGQTFGFADLSLPSVPYKG